jgi:hypothetical protein
VLPLVLMDRRLPVAVRITLSNFGKSCNWRSKIRLFYVEVSTFVRLLRSPLALARLAGTDPDRVRARKHSRRYCDNRYDDEGDHERRDDGNMKDQQTPDEGTHEHSCH